MGGGGGNPVEMQRRQSEVEKTKEMKKRWTHMRIKERTRRHVINVFTS
jgi:hypothetical protein